MNATRLSFRMLFEPTTLSATARLIADTLKSDYSVDPEPVFSAANLDISQLSIPGARYPTQNMQALWRAAVKASGDPCFGLYAGRRVRPSFHALGFSWLASQSLLGALRRLCRYHDVITTMPLQLEITERADRHVMTIEYPDPHYAPEIASIDGLVMAIVQLCRFASDRDFAPLKVVFKRDERQSLQTYVELLGCPVETGAECVTIEFDRQQLEAPLPGLNLELARANDSVVEKYLATLDSQKVTAEVRELMITLLPSGNSNQVRIAEKMNRSLSTLQRQLSQEGTSYKEIRDETRRQLATEYVRERKLSLSQIAYMLGFSDQSNFSRAFRRWTGVSPRDYQ